MTVSLPRLNSLTGMVEPTTGDPTVRMQSFWNQAMYAIETLQATPGGVSSFNTRVGAVTLAGIDVTTALGYIPTSPASLAAALAPYALQSAVVTSLGGAVGAVTLGSGLTMTGQVLAATGGGGGGSITITDGSTSIAGLTVLTVNNLDLVSAYNPPSIVQSNFSGAATISLTNPSTVGNTLILIGSDRTPITTPSGWSIGTGFNEAGGGYNSIVGIYTKAASGTVETTTIGSGAYNEFGLFEISGDPSLLFASGGGNFTLATPTSETPFIALSVFSTVYGTPLYSDPLPSGSTILNQLNQGANYVAWTKSAVVSDSTTNVGISASTTGQAISVATVLIEATPTGTNASLTPAIPVSITGGTSGAFQSIVAPPGSSLSGKILTLPSGGGFTYGTSTIDTIALAGALTGSVSGTTLTITGTGGGGGGATIFTAGAATLLAYDPGTANPGSVITGCTITLPASATATQYLVTGMTEWTGHGVRHAVCLDGAFIGPAAAAGNGYDWAGTGDGVIFWTIAGLIVTSPGDGATHVLAIYGSDSGSAGTVNYYNRWLTATEL